MMTIEADLKVDMKQAMRDKDSAKVACIRQIQAKVQAESNEKNFKGEIDDAMFVRNIASYVKSLQKSMKEFEGGGERGAELVATYQNEIDYLQKFLPTKLDEAATQALVIAAVAELGANDPKMAGRLMGHIMKKHKDEVDSGVLKRLVDAAFA